MIRAVMLIKSGGRVPRAVNLAREIRRVAHVTDAYAVFGRNNEHGNLGRRPRKPR
jgi:hypothetical protein